MKQESGGAVIQEKIEHCGMTALGRVRPENEDAWIAVPEEGLYIVADGMGGRAAGEVAAAMVIQQLPELIKEKISADADVGSEKIQGLLTEILELVSRQIYEAGLSRRSQQGMGSTVVLCLIRGKKIIVANVGDSRAYLLRGQTLERLTKDHSVFQQLVDQGLVPEQAQRGHPARFQLTQCMGQPDKVVPGIAVRELASGDLFLLCTDGLHDMLNDTHILKIISQSPVPLNTCSELLAAANRSGGLDNVTVVEIKVNQVR
jgi:protein phosphatase